MTKYLFIALFLSFTFKNFAQDVKDILSKIPSNDREALESLFYRMMNNDHFNYTLFGDKPISLSGDFNLTPYENILWARQRCGGAFWKNWEIWEQYQNFFPLKNYLFIKEPSINSPHVVNIIFINKKQFIEKINQYLDVFQESLKRNVTGESLLIEIEEKKRFAPIIKNDELLWGILLGYGVHNAALYSERLKLEQFINFEDLPKIPEKKPSSQGKFSCIEEEYEYLTSKLKFFGEYSYSPLIARSVHFVADLNHPETKALEKKYTQLRSKISAIYAQGNFLEIALSKLTSND